MKNKTLLNYLRLTRLSGAGSTAIAVIICYLAMKGSYDLINLSILFIIGIFGHIFGSVLNDYVDIKVDKKSEYHKEKPLVSGAITKNQALFITLFSCFCGYALTIIFFWSIYPLIFLSLALLFTIIYDVKGKEILGSDVFMGGSAFFGCLFGASIVSIHFSNLVIIISIAVFIYIVSFTGVVGGLKDADHDALAGGKTTATRMGVNIVNGKMLVTNKFKIFSYGLDVVYIVLIILAALQPETNLWQSNQYILLIIMAFFTVITFGSLYGFLNMSYFDRPKLYGLFALHGVTSFILVPILLLPIIGLNMMLAVIILPIAWYIIFNKIIFNTIVVR